MSKVKLYVKFDDWDEYYPAVAVKCDVCGKVFQIRKGFFLKEDVIACYKHLSKEFLEKFHD